MEKKKPLTLYETLFIIRPEHGSRAKELVEKFRNVVESRGATVTHVEEWGIRDLAYPIQKQSKGHYNLMQYRAPAGTVEELERQMKLSDEVMRAISVRLEDGETPPAAEA